jgi:hypothetical protein
VGIQEVDLGAVVRICDDVKGTMTAGAPQRDQDSMLGGIVFGECRGIFLRAQTASLVASLASGQNISRTVVASGRSSASLRYTIFQE